MRPIDLLFERAESSPGHPFLRFQEGDLNYGQAAERVRRLAGGLAEIGVGAGSTVGILMGNSIEHVLCSFAAAQLGAVSVPVNTALKGPLLAHPLGLAACRVVVIDHQLLDRLAAVAGELPQLRYVIVRGQMTGEPRRCGQAELIPFESFSEAMALLPLQPTHDLDPAMMLFTSGTSGPSKACVLSHRYLLRQAQWHGKYLELDSADVLYTPFPLFHIDAATLTVHAALVLGATAAIGKRFSVSGFWPEVRSFDATVFNFMGATATLLWKQEPSPDDRRHRVRLAWGVPMPERHAEWQDRFGFPLYEVYGLTDAGVVSYDPLDGQHRQGACGRVIDEYEVAIGDPRGDLLPPGHAGEILIRPREPGTVMNEYFGMPDATLAAFRGLWFHTGDLGKLDADGFLYFLGRSKDTIRRRGENISLYEVEQLVQQHPGVLEAAAVGVASELSEDDLKICVVVRPGFRLTHEELADYCRERAPDFMVPRYIEFLSHLPKTPTEKVERFKLRNEGLTLATWDREGRAVTRSERSERMG